MGNCIRLPCCSQPGETRVLICNGGKAEFRTKQDPGEVYYLMPPIKEPACKRVGLGKSGTCGMQRIKILLTRKQLELLLRDVKELKSKAERKWQPSLATIQEVQKFKANCESQKVFFYLPF